MSASSIEWTEHTWNPIAGCTPVSPGCLNCYAATMSRRLAAMGQSKYVGLTVRRGGRDVFNGEISFDEAALSIPLTRRKPTVWFVNSMSDLFHEDVPFNFFDRVFAVMAMTPRHTYQVLTKRPERMAEYLLHRRSPIGFKTEECISSEALELCCQAQSDGRPINSGRRFTKDGPVPWPLSNVWLGTSVEDQQRADERIPHLLKCPAAVRFLSCEPLLGSLSLTDMPCEPTSENIYMTHVDPLRGWYSDRPGKCGPGCGSKAKIDWVIVGGESGPGARPMRLAWARSIIDQCRAAGVPCFVKQLGGNMHDDDANEVNRAGFVVHDPKGGNPAEWPEYLRVRQMPASSNA